MQQVLRGALPHIRVPGRTLKELAAPLRAGEVSFILDDDGKFIAR
ncbi:hypothetical protein ACFPL7_11510 [Dongia soli]|uniref:Uncharacterized protein n=1 Tax=Dongia soli TaxID=600628 RepID=A0ABU5EB49_9PROT|nr:hypothetical protein [Dongia soli]MDY0883576.1 hypothetical protein [Dongia soli]